MSTWHRIQQILLRVFIFGVSTFGYLKQFTLHTQCMRSVQAAWQGFKQDCSQSGLEKRLQSWQADITTLLKALRAWCIRNLLIREHSAHLLRRLQHWLSLCRVMYLQGVGCCKKICGTDASQWSWKIKRLLRHWEDDTWRERLSRLQQSLQASINQTPYEYEFKLYQRVLASTLSICIFASTLIVQHAQAQAPLPEDSAGSQAIPDAASAQPASATKTNRQKKGAFSSPGLGAGAGSSAGVILGSGPGSGAAAIKLALPITSAASAASITSLVSATSSVTDEPVNLSNSASKANTNKAPTPTLTAAPAQTQATTLQERLGPVDHSAGASAGYTLGVGEGQSAGASAGPALVWGPGPGPGVRTVTVMPARTAKPDTPKAVVSNTVPSPSKVAEPAETVVVVQEAHPIPVPANPTVTPAVSAATTRKSKNQKEAKTAKATPESKEETANIGVSNQLSASAQEEPKAVAGMRLSEWLIQDQRRKQTMTEASVSGAEQPKVATAPSVPEKPDPYLLGMAWIVPSEIPAQTAQKDVLLETLNKLKAPGSEPSFDTSRKALRELIESMPVTGRALLPNTSARYLEINPQLDPILQAGEEIRIPPTPESITVIRSDGLLCKVRYQPNVETRQYYRACRAQAVVADWAWVIEPDGKVRVVPTADWNEAKQDLPAPGAWIWAPPRSSGWSDSDARAFSEQLAAFLSTQEVSGDALSPDNDVNLRRPPILSVDDRYMTSRDLPITRSIWGEVGLLETPSARIAPAGTAAIGVSNANPYGQLNFFLTPVDFAEFGFRYTNINNIPYGSYSNQTYKDKSFDIKFRLWKESAYLPEIAVGGRDILGTGLFSGEYVMANKRVSNFDFSLGMGWGYLGSRNNIPNPFKKISSAYATRPPPVVGEGGTLSGNYFYGPSALMGGVQYHTPVNGLILKAELDGNNYQHEPFGVALPTKTPLNFGAVYQTKNVDFTAGLRGGNTFMVGLTLHERLDQLAAPKLAEARPVPVELKEIGYQAPQRGESTITGKVSTSFSQDTIYNDPNLRVDLSDPFSVKTNSKNTKLSASNSTNQASSGYQGNLQVNSANANANTAAVVGSNAQALNPSTRTVTRSGAVNTSAQVTPTQTLLDLQTLTGWQVNSIREAGNTWIVQFNDASGVYLRERIDRGVGVLHRDAPSNIQEFQLEFFNKGLQVSDYKVDRVQWMLSQTQLLPPSQKKTIVEPLTAQTADQTPRGTVWGRLDHKPYDGDLGLDYFQVIGGPDTPLLFAVSATGTGSYNFDRNTWLTGTVSARLVDNFGKFNYTGPTNLQPVRTDIRQYMTTSVATMPNLQATRTFQLGGDHFASVYAGYLEMMFAGAGGEYLYRPSNSRFAVGIDANRVRQRQFNQWTSLQNYSVNTGHLTGYWDTGLEDILVKFSVGQYLAGDRGGTLDLSRVFQNGVKIGAYVTRTNVSYSQFGEGSFDKGVYITIPFDAFFARHSDSVANLLWTPLIRDGGAMLYRKYPLYNLTNSRDGRALTTGQWQLAE